MVLMDIAGFSNVQNIKHSDFYELQNSALAA
jgi:hypothetical protein